MEQESFLKLLHPIGLVNKDIFMCFALISIHSAQIGLVSDKNIKT